MTGPDTPTKSSRPAVDRIKQLMSDFRRSFRISRLSNFSPRLQFPRSVINVQGRSRD